MNSPWISIGWELLARKRWATALVALVFPVSYGLNLLWPNLARPMRDPVSGGSEGGWLMPFEFVGFLLSMATLFWLFSFAEPDRTGKRIGFPARSFVLPMRTSHLVAIPVVIGLVCVVLYYFLWSGLIFSQWGANLRPGALSIHLLTVAAMLICTQAVVWSFAAFPWIRMILTIVLVVGLAIVGIAVPEREFWSISPNAICFLLFLIALGWFGAVSGVARDRCGNWQGWTGKLLERFGEALPGRRREFVSASQAQFWCEWQRKGWFLSLLLALPVAISLVLFLIPSSLLLVDARAGFILCAPAILLLLVASSMGGSVSKTDFWSARLGLSSFAATRPITTGELVIAKLKVAALILLAGWAIIIALSPLAFNAPRWLLPEEFPVPTWTEVKEHFPTFVTLLSNPVLYLAVFAVTWQSVVAGLSIALLGRPNKVLFLSFVGLIIFMSILSAGPWIVEHPQFHSILFPPLICTAIVLAAIKVMAAMRAFRKVHEHSLFLPPHFVTVVALWCVTAVGIAAGAWLLQHHAILPAPLLLFLVAYFLPSTELPNCALHLARDRHR